jgi:hypothetical protein
MEVLQRKVCRSWLSGLVGVSRSSMNRWHVQGPPQKIARRASNAMSAAERQQILDLLHSEEFVEDTRLTRLLASSWIVGDGFVL